MLAECLADLLAQSFVVFEVLHFPDFSKILECLVVKLIDVTYVLIGDDHIWQRLHISYAMCKSAIWSALR